MSSLFFSLYYGLAFSLSYFVSSFFFVEVWLDEPLGYDRGRDRDDNNNSVFLLTVDDTMSMVGSATTTTMCLTPTPSHVLACSNMFNLLKHVQTYFNMF